MTLEQTMDAAMQAHQSGRLREAEQLYRQVLSETPDHPSALHFLGVIAYQVGNRDVAEKLMRRSTELRPTMALFHRDLGEVLRSGGKLQEALAACRRAVQLQPDMGEAWSNLGICLEQAGQLDEAMAAHRKAVELRPSTAGVHSNLGNCLIAAGKPDEALEALRRAIQLDPRLAPAHNNLGNALRELGRTDEAVNAYRAAIQLEPRNASAYNNLGAVLQGMGRFEEAIAVLRQATELSPNLPEAWDNLGICLRQTGRMADAEQAHRKAAQLAPNSPTVHVNLANCLDAQGRLDDAIAEHERALQLDPSFAPSHNNLAVLLKDQARLADALAHYRKAVELSPNTTAFHSNLLFALHLDPASDPKAVFDEHLNWAKRHADALTEKAQPHANDRDPKRKLRIGYVSPDFRDHVVASCIEPVLAAHDRQAFEVFCYSDSPREDLVSQRLRGLVDRWGRIAGMSDERLAQQIREDRIDILVDLALHTAHNRALLFARKPAPVQVNWLAYAGTSGMRAMDWRITDAHVDPPGETEAFNTERLHRLPQTLWCYKPHEKSPEPNDLPARQRGYVTFVSPNNFAKLNAQVVAVWSQVLQSIPGSRLIVYLRGGAEHNRHAGELFSSHGIAGERVEFRPHLPRGEHLRLYHDADLTLDPFPFNGGVTTLDSLWMGVPVISLAGRGGVSRVGASILSNLGLDELVTSTSDFYVQLASAWAQDLDQLQSLRRELRSRMVSSPLLDATGFTRQLEAAYRAMFEQWCAGRS
jgi:predicted O-linked N-acetylglucosamine transferase (SPINDLY family)